jgi:hypothetical protein
MTAQRQFLGALAATILVPIATWGQGGSITNSPFAPVAVPGGLSVTNAPAAMPLNVPQPSLPEITVPQPAQVNVPLATDPPPPAPSTPLSPSPRPLPLLVPSTQELVTKSMASGPGGSLNRLAAITATPLTLSPTNTSTTTMSVPAAPLTNSSTHPSSVWDKNTPLLNGVDYHW